MKYFIDNLIVAAVKAANKKGHKLSVRIEEKCPWIPYRKWWYAIHREGGGDVYLLCDRHSVRNVIFHLHFFCIGEKIEAWTFAEDFNGGQP